MTRRRWRARALVVVTMVTLAVIGVGVAPADAHRSPPPPAPTYRVGTVFDGLWAWLTAPRSMPPAVNVPGCRPSRQHPYPVVLVHGTIANAAFSWQALAPELANDGYCVYAFNYGLTTLWPAYLGGLADVSSSAAELSTFVDSVLASTGADEVDIVGHSQGGMMPRYYVKDLGGASKVHTLIGLSPSNHGTNLFGLNTLINALSIGGTPLFDAIDCEACTQQVVPSPFLDALNAGSETEPGVNEVVITTRYDEVVTPYTSAFLAGDGVRNITVQDQCPTDYTDHIGIVYDPVALQDVRAALEHPRRPFQPTCSVVWPVFSG